MVTWPDEQCGYNRGNRIAVPGESHPKSRLKTDEISVSIDGTHSHPSILITTFSFQSSNPVVVVEVLAPAPHPIQLRSRRSKSPRGFCAANDEFLTPDLQSFPGSDGGAATPSRPDRRGGVPVRFVVVISCHRFIFVAMFRTREPKRCRRKERSTHSPSLRQLAKHGLRHEQERYAIGSVEFQFQYAFIAIVIPVFW